MKQPTVINKINKLASCLYKKHTKINSPKENLIQVLDPKAAGFVGVPKCLFSPWPWILNNKG
jgi:hypothetical protein